LKENQLDTLNRQYRPDIDLLRTGFKDSAESELTRPSRLRNG